MNEEIEGALPSFITETVAELTYKFDKMEK
jgi:hypothetical protein